MIIFLFATLYSALTVLETLWATHILSCFLGHSIHPLWIFVIYVVLNWIQLLGHLIKREHFLAWRTNQFMWLVIFQVSIWIYEWIK